MADTYTRVLLLDELGNGISPFVNIATSTTAGAVIPDGTSITIDEEGIISATASLTGTVGNSTTPVYLNNGTITACSKSIPTFQISGTTLIVS